MCPPLLLLLHLLQPAPPKPLLSVVLQAAGVAAALSPAAGWSPGCPKQTSGGLAGEASRQLSAAPQLLPVPVADRPTSSVGGSSIPWEGGNVALALSSPVEWLCCRPFGVAPIGEAVSLPHTLCSWAFLGLMALPVALHREGHKTKACKQPLQFCMQFWLQGPQTNSVFSLERRWGGYSTGDDGSGAAKYPTPSTFSFFFFERTSPHSGPAYGEETLHAFWGGAALPSLRLAASQVLSPFLSTARTFKGFQI